MGGEGIYLERGSEAYGRSFPKLSPEEGLVSGEKALLEKLRDCVVRFDLEGVRSACLEALEEGIPAERAIIEGLARGMDIVGQLFEDDEYFLPDLVMAAEAMSEGTAILRRHVKKDTVSRGRVTIGTVRGDIHDIGKNIVKNLLEAAGFSVQDLGVDVSPDTFVRSVKAGTDIVALSSLLTTTRREMGLIVEALSREDLRSKVKVMVGGASVTQSFAKKIGADGYGEDAIQAVELAKLWSMDSGERGKQSL